VTSIYNELQFACPIEDDCSEDRVAPEWIEVSLVLLIEVLLSGGGNGEDGENEKPNYLPGEPPRAQQHGNKKRARRVMSSPLDS